MNGAFDFSFLPASQLFYYGAAAAMLGVLVVIHELGHFIVARAFGIAVPVFSIGWGPRAFGFKLGGTDFRVSWLALGGYMRAAGADPFSEGGESVDSYDVPADQRFDTKPAWQRALVKLAGPMMNLFLGFFIFFLVFVAGQPQPLAQVMDIAPGSAAERAGVAPLDTIVAVNGTPVVSWYDVQEEFAEAPSDPVVVEIERGGTRQTVTLDAASPRLPLSPFEFGVSGQSPGTVVSVDDPASPAARAGIATGDRIVAVGGVPVRNIHDLARAFAAADGETPVRVERRASEMKEEEVVVAVGPWSGVATPSDDALWQRTGIATANVSVKAFAEISPQAKDAGMMVGDRVLKVDERVVRRSRDVVGAIAARVDGEGAEQVAQPVNFTVRRAGQILELPVMPRVVKDTDEAGRYTYRALVGIEFEGDYVATEDVARRYPVGEAAVRSALQVKNVTFAIVERIGELIMREAAPSKSLGGPIEMFSQASRAARQGVAELSQLTGFLSISLFVMNLLPVPVFDGGDILLYLAEAVRGRPLPRLFRERAQQFGILFIVVLMVSVFAMDIHRAIVG